MSDKLVVTKEMKRKGSGSRRNSQIEKHVVLEGELDKQCPFKFLGITRYQTRYFVLNREFLVWKKDKDDITHKGILPLRDITRMECKENIFTLEITVPEPKSFLLRAADKELCRHWFTTIQAYQIESRHRPPSLSFNKTGKWWKKSDSSIQLEDVAEGTKERSESFSLRNKSSAISIDSDRQDEPSNSAFTVIGANYKANLEITDSKMDRDDDENENYIPTTSSNMNESDLMLNNYEIAFELPFCAFGTVHLAYNKKTGEPVIVHLINKSAEFVSMALENVATLSRLKDPSLMLQIEKGESGDNYYGVYSYGVGGPLYAHLSSQSARHLSEDVAKRYLAEILVALGYLHSQDILFSNMNLESILLDINDHVVITNFFFSANHQIINDLLDILLPEYLTPDCIENAEEDRASDWWRFGVLAYELVVGYPPFRSTDQDDLLGKIVAGKIRFPSFISNDARDLISKLLVVDPQKRLGGGPDDIKEIISHPFFASIDWNELRASRTPPANRKYEIDIEVFEASSLMCDDNTALCLAFTPPFYKALSKSDEKDFSSVITTSVQRTSNHSAIWNEHIKIDVSPYGIGDLKISLMKKGKFSFSDGVLSTVIIKVDEIHQYRTFENEIKFFDETEEKKCKKYFYISYGILADPNDALSIGVVKMKLTWNVTDP